MIVLGISFYEVTKARKGQNRSPVVTNCFYAA